MKTDTTLTARLRTEAAMLNETRISTLFRDDPARFERFSLRENDLLLDFSKCKMRAETLALLVKLSEEAGLAEARDAMMAGAPVNITESRAALHTALRDFSGAPILVDGVDMAPEIAAMRRRCFCFAEGVRSGTIMAADGKPFTDIVNLGIGGSDLGPAMLAEALKPYADGPRLHFVSNVDGAHLADTLKGLDAARTLFIIASKTFTTIETMTNARTARAWLVAKLSEAAVGAHFAAVSTALDKVSAFGIAPERVFGFWDFVGGRYSIWSAIGLAVMIGIGAERFTRFLAGAESMDRHFKSAPLARNMPVLLGLIGVWHRNFCGYAARAIIPYAQRLARFPAYLQQLDMESNGKSVRQDGRAVSGETGPLVWGEPGTNGQHAFFQLLHQGTSIIPVEFLLGVEGEADPLFAAHQPLLIANCLAQAQALMEGRNLEEAGGNPHRVFTGDRPSVMLLFKRLDPFTLGQIIALYEHRVFVEARLWGINPFDQWGVELGKALASKLEKPLTTGEGIEALDGSTTGLLAYILAMT